MVRQAGIEPALPCLWCGILDLNQYIKMLLTSIPQRQVPYHLATGAYHISEVPDPLRQYHLINFHASFRKLIKYMAFSGQTTNLPNHFITYFVGKNLG